MMIVNDQSRTMLKQATPFDGARIKVLSWRDVLCQVAISQS